MLPASTVVIIFFVSLGAILVLMALVCITCRKRMLTLLMVIEDPKIESKQQKSLGKSDTGKESHDTASRTVGESASCIVTSEESPAVTTSLGRTATTETDTVVMTANYSYDRVVELHLGMAEPECVMTMTTNHSYGKLGLTTGPGVTMTTNQRAADQMNKLDNSGYSAQCLNSTIDMTTNHAYGITMEEPRFRERNLDILTIQNCTYDSAWDGKDGCPNTAVSRKTTRSHPDNKAVPRETETKTSKPHISYIQSEV